MTKLRESKLQKVSGEEDFHDRWADSVVLEEVLVDESFTAITALENRYALESLGNIAGKTILDVGCGFGEASIFFAKKGAKVTSVDISTKMLKMVEELSHLHNTRKNITLVKASVDTLPFKEKTFDKVFANNVLHHTPAPEKACLEIKRVLKKGGTGIFIEPLAHNPLINVYRKIAKKVRTEGEHPFTIKQIKSIMDSFEVSIHKEFQLLTLLIFVWFFLGERVNPNEERYWKKIIRDSRKYEWIYPYLSDMDEFLLKRLPWLRKYCWNTVVVVGKQ